MNIYFTVAQETIDVIGKDLEGIKEDIETVRLPEATKDIYRKVKSQIERRFMLFKEEISAYEKDNPEAYTLINFTNSPAKVEFFNYSDSVTKKMNESFGNDDLDFIERLYF